ncbi:MAG: TlpA family protein disulfide reductase [Actinomycetota bacterium]
MIVEREVDTPERGGSPLVRVVVVLAPLLLLFALMGVSVFRASPRDVGSRAPAFELERLDGRGRISSADLRGKAYALNFWASWCIPCRDEAPVLAKIAGSGVGPPAFIGVNILDGLEEARAFVQEFDIRYPNGRDRKGVFRAFRVAGIPETIFVSRQGQIVGRWIGAIDGPTLRRLLSELRSIRSGELLRISGRGPQVGVQ